MRIISKLSKSEKGQSAVEFALILPILLLLILGMIEYGWLLNAQITLTSAAREGARVAAVAVVDKRVNALAAINNSVNGKSGILPIQDTLSEFVYTTPPGNVEDVAIRYVKIEINGKVKPIIGLYVSNPFWIKATATMRLE